MPYEKPPSLGAFLPLSLMYFLSGEPMHDLSGVDTCGLTVKTADFEEQNTKPHKRFSSTTNELIYIHIYPSHELTSRVFLMEGKGSSP